MTSLAAQSMSKTQTSYKDPNLSQLAQGLCIPINVAPTHPPTALTITRATSNVSNIDPIDALPPPIVHFGEIPKTSATSKRQQENCSALARHLFVLVKNIRFYTKAEVAKWCRTNILVNIIWRLSTLSLVKRRGKKSVNYVQLST
jgi:hypothetical protein